MVTKKGLTIFMTLGLVPLLACFVALFLYEFLIVKKLDERVLYQNYIILNNIYVNIHNNIVIIGNLNICDLVYNKGPFNSVKQLGYYL